MSAPASGRHDHALRRRSRRSGRERGCWIYIPAEYLPAMGFPADAPAPFYRIWADSKRPRVVVNLYTER